MDDGDTFSIAECDMIQLYISFYILQLNSIVPVLQFLFLIQQHEYAFRSCQRGKQFIDNIRDFIDRS